MLLIKDRYFFHGIIYIYVIVFISGHNCFSSRGESVIKCYQEVIFYVQFDIFCSAQLRWFLQRSLCLKVKDDDDNDDNDKVDDKEHQTITSKVFNVYALKQWSSN